MGLLDAMTQPPAAAPGGLLGGMAQGQGAQGGGLAMAQQLAQNPTPQMAQQVLQQLRQKPGPEAQQLAAMLEKAVGDPRQIRQFADMVMQHVGGGQ